MIDRAFIIDDDEISIFLTSVMLETELFARHIESFDNAKDALIQLRNSNNELLPQVIFLDLNMPVLSGWEFLDALTENEERYKDKCSVFILTSSVDEQEKELAKQYRLVTGFLQKPLDERAIRRIKSRI
ncbi:response regulator [Pontibacter sp. KCTC 32443]|uniref:response regulator n=1 Tax=Pontibacter TaxID=323449 RepID=UPI00164E4B30|nr:MULTISPECIES: response regulator [Pontibacter]MBC5772683.1 response regulator [Pontibacter sp. KCTC 32443]